MREDGYYWVYRGVWQIAEYEYDKKYRKGIWSLPGHGGMFYDSDFEKIGEKIERNGS